MIEKSSTGRRIVRAMFIVIFFYLFWKFGGFLLNVLIGSLFPSGKESDAFLCAYSSVIFLFYGVVLKFFTPAFMPLFIEEMEKRGEDSAWKFAGGVINTLAIILAVGVVAGMVFAPTIIRAIAEGYFQKTGDPRGAMTIQWTRIMLPGLLGVCIGIFTYALLNSYKIFSYPAAGEAAQKLTWAGALFVMVFLFKMGAVAIPIGFLIGVAAQLVINFLGLRPKLRFYRLVGLVAPKAHLLKELIVLLIFVLALAGLFKVFPTLRMTGRRQLVTVICVVSAYLLLTSYRSREAQSLIGRFVSLACPLLIGVLIARMLRDLITDNYTTYAATGMFSDKKFAEKIGQLPNVIIAYALSIAMFPYLCELAIKEHREALGDLVNRAIRMIALFFAPLSVTMALLSRPLMQLVFDRGNWQAEHLYYGGVALAFFISGLFFYSVENILMQSFFSMQRMWTPTIVGLIASVFHVCFLFVCDHFMHLTDGTPESQTRLFYVVIIAFPLSRAFKNILLMALLRMRIKILPLVPTAAFIGKLCLLCAAVTATVMFSYRLLSPFAGVEKLKGRSVEIDTFSDDEVPFRWRAGEGTHVRIENVHGPHEQPECALRVDGPVHLFLSLKEFDLHDVDVLKFKAKSERSAELRVIVHSTAGTYEGRVRVSPSDAREQYSLAADDLEPVRGENTNASKAFSTAERIEFAEVGAGGEGSMWFDTVILESRFPFSRWARFELAKAIVVGIPFLLGILVGVAAAFILRVPEMRIMLNWLKEQKLSRLLSRQRGDVGGGVIDG